MQPGEPAETKQLSTLRNYLAGLNRDEMETDPQSIVYKLLNEYAKAGKLLAHLAVNDPDVEICSGALLIIFLALKDSQIPGKFQAQVRTEAGDILEQALRDPATSDDRKFMLGPAAFLCDIKMSEEEYRGLFQDFEKISQRKFKEYADGILDNPPAIDKVLVTSDPDELKQKGEPEKLTAPALETELNRAGALCQHNPPVGAALLILTLAVGQAQGLDIADGEKVLEFAARTAPGRAAWYLQELGRMPGMGALSLSAARLARTLIHDGARPRCPVAGDFSHGWVSQVDGAGSRSLNLYFRTADGGMDGLTLLLNDETGIKEMFCVFGEGAALEEEVRRRSTQVAFSACSLEMARAMVATALAQHQAKQTPPPPRFLLYRYLLGPAALPAQPQPPRLGAYLLETVVFSPALVAESADLVESPLFGALWCNSDVAYGWLGDYLAGRPAKGARAAGAAAPPATSGKALRGKTSRRKKMKLGKKALHDYIAAVCLPERDKLLRRLALNLEFEAWRGRAKHPENRVAALVYLALEQQRMPFAEIPYVRELARVGSANIAENIYYGYKTQAEVESASLEIDEETESYIDDLLDEAP